MLLVQFLDKKEGDIPARAAMMSQFTENEWVTTLFFSIKAKHLLVLCFLNVRFDGFLFHT